MRVKPKIFGYKRRVLFLLLNGEKVEGRSFTRLWARKKEAHICLQAACGEFIATLPPFIDLHPSERVKCVMREKLIIF